MSRSLIGAVALTALVTTLAAVSVEPRRDDDVELCLPRCDWGIALDRGRLEYRPAWLSDDGTEVTISGRDLTRGLRVDVTIARQAEPPRDGVDCRDRRWDRLLRTQERLTRVQFREHDGVATAEYVVLGYGEMRPSARHIHAFLAMEDACVQVHALQQPQRMIDRDQLERIVDSLRVRLYDDGSRQVGRAENATEAEAARGEPATSPPRDLRSNGFEDEPAE